ncbi:cytoplasmic FMR1-interacting protein 1-like [Amphiura filiformis]|uniref:cytoplasmic FMR1-interacting protein 1-like n=1 Tax=Amphiura filiformis TaxID=82378 RepID=UPI003B20E079
MTEQAPPPASPPAAEQVSLSDGLATIDGLATLISDDQKPKDQESKDQQPIGQRKKDQQPPCIEAVTAAVTYHANFDTNFVDRNAYIANMPKYMEETKAHSELNKLLDEGEAYASMLYTWRGCSRAMPSIKSNDQPNRTEIYQTFVDIMKPEIEKLFNFMRFQARAVDVFCSDIKRVSQQEKKNEFWSESYLLTLGKVINMFVVLDALKDIKSSINNDYSAYKRGAQVVRVLDSPDALQESHAMVTFLANKSEIAKTLKKKLGEVEGYDEILADIINLCATMYDKEQFVLPREKHMLIKIIAFGLYLIDTPENNMYKTDQKKKRMVHLSKVNSLFKQLQCVPLYGDQQLEVFAYIRMTPNFESHKSFWTCDSSAKLEAQYNILQRLPSMKEDHTKFISDLAKHSHKMVKSGEKKKRSESEQKALKQLAFRGLRLISSWTAKVTELFSWKLIHPADKRENKDINDDTDDYEKALRYNYNNQERFALIEVIAMIKGLQVLLNRMGSEFHEAIETTIFAEMQDFVQITLRDPIRTAVKKKRKTTESVLLRIRDACANWLNGNAPVDDPSMKGKKDPPDGFKIKVPRKRVSPSTTQIYAMRTMLESLISDRTGGGKSKSMKKDFDGRTIEAIADFLRKSFFYNHLINFSETLQECCDLSQMWYREFFLELTNGQRIQFPIEMSMPWILIDHILETKDPAMMECILYPLDLYSDSAHYALTKFKKQFLYDEIEAEVKLCFEQLVIKLSDQIFAHYKTVAASILLDKRFRLDCEKNGIPIPDPFPSANRYDTLLRQTNVQVLGRSIDLSKLLKQRLTAAMQKSLDYAITKFEASDLTHIVELDVLLEVNKLTHRLLSKHVHLADFECMLQEANNNVVAPFGRITLHIFWEVYYDFMPKYCYNGTTHRFTQSELASLDPVDRGKPPSASTAFQYGDKRLNSAYEKVTELYSSFIGMPHFRCIVRLVHYKGIAIIIEELLKIIRTLIQNTLLQYFKILTEAMPKKCQLTRQDFGTMGAVAYYSAHLQDIIQYADLRQVVFGHFQEVGNAIIFFKKMEEALAVEETMDLHHAAPFQNLIPKPYAKQNENSDMKMKRLEQNFETLRVAEIIEKFGTTEQKSYTKEADLLTKERLCSGLSMFQVILQRIQTFFDDPAWNGGEPANGIIHIDECTEFHRLWSAIQFVYCFPLKQGEYTPEETHGDGLNWAGATMITLLGQQRRFHALDFCYHILRVHGVDGQKDDINGISTVRLIDRITKYRSLNNEIFSVLKNYLSYGEPDEPVQIDQVTCYQPPVHHSQIDDD